MRFFVIRVVLFLYTFDAARTHLLANNGGRMVIGVRGFRLRQEEEREWGNEYVNDGEEMGRMGGRCNAMRMEFERKSGNRIRG